jgi:hypothetical protein
VKQHMVLQLSERACQGVVQCLWSASDAAAYGPTAAAAGVLGSFSGWHACWTCLGARQGGQSCSRVCFGVLGSPFCSSRVHMQQGIAAAPSQRALIGPRWAAEGCQLQRAPVHSHLQVPCVPTAQARPIGLGRILLQLLLLLHGSGWSREHSRGSLAWLMGLNNTGKALPQVCVTKCGACMCCLARPLTATAAAAAAVAAAVDEAGRGPVLGAMVYGVMAAPISYRDTLAKQ